MKNLFLKEGFKIFPFDKGIFIYPEKKIIVYYYIDDFLITGEIKNEVLEVINKVSKEITLKDMGEVSEFLGNEIDIDRKNKTILIHQTKYTLNAISKYNKGGTIKYPTPFEPGVKLRKATTKAAEEDITLYQQQIGALLYLALKTRPDIAFAINKLSRFSTNPDQSHFKALDRVWGYLNRYPSLGLLYNCNEDLYIKVYSDSDWGSSLDDRKSTSGYISCIGNNFIN